MGVAGSPEEVKLYTDAFDTAKEVSVSIFHQNTSLGSDEIGVITMSTLEHVVDGNSACLTIQTKNRDHFTPSLKKLLRSKSTRKIVSLNFHKL